MKSLKERVAQIYYTHGLFCASHPYSILGTVICFMLMTFYPLLNFPLPGNAPAKYSTKVKDYKVPELSLPAPAIQTITEEDKKMIPKWYIGKPVGYVQQIIVKTAVSPWQHGHMIPNDAFRAPLSNVFDVIQQLDSFKYKNSESEVSVADICLRVPETISSTNAKSILPQYACLELSPANFWQRDISKFKSDGEILQTIFRRHGQTLEAPPYIRDILFGIPWKESGISRYFIRNKQRTITFAVTFVMKNYDAGFMDSLKKNLENSFPETVKNVNNSEIDYIVHIHYKEVKIFVDYMLLILTYIVLLMYLYFSVRKIEMVKSKWGLALSAVVTVVSSLLMSVSICTVFGLTPTLNGGEIFPYLVVIIGLENILVITKSVVSTPVDLEVKYRIAKGISKEGWSITKNLATELMIVMCGFFTFVPAIQEFALFALVGLLSDFFLQIVFFVTVLSVDIRRMELSDLHKKTICPPTVVSEDKPVETIEPLMRCPVMTYIGPPPKSPMDISQTRSPTTKLQTPAANPPRTYSPPASPGVGAREEFFQDQTLLRIPRRLRLIYFWANTRMFQRLIMLCTVIWIALIIYKTGLVQHITNSTDSTYQTADPTKPSYLPDTDSGRNSDRSEFSKHASSVSEQDGRRTDNIQFSWKSYEEEEVDSLVEHKTVELWKDLSYKHWPTLFGYYNISLVGRYISILPSFHLSVLVDPDTAIQMRHPSEKVPTQTTMAESPDGKPADIHDEKVGIPPYYMYDPEHLKQFIPKSQTEVAITVCLVVLSFICITYFMVVLYRCMCSRTYGRKVRGGRRHSKHGKYYRQIKPSVPKVLRGHLQEIECVVTDSNYIISSCLGGQLRVWDSVTGDCITVILRRSDTPPVKRRPCLGRNIEDSDADLYAEYHGDKSDSVISGFPSPEDYAGPRFRTSSQKSTRNLFGNEPDLSSTIDTNFTNLSQISAESAQSTGSGYNFSGKFDNLYKEHKNFMIQTEEQQESQQDNQLLEAIRSRSWSAGDNPVTMEHDAALFDEGFQNNQAPSIWCLTCHEGLIAAGCGNGRIEFWDGSSGNFKYMYGESKVGVTSLCFKGKRVVAGRLDGSIEFLEIETFQNPVITPLIPSKPHQKGHTRNYSQQITTVPSLRKWEEIIHVTQIKIIKAHQQPIISLHCEGGRVVSSSQDHTLKVFRLDDCLCLYTLHGHTDRITVVYVDKSPPYHVASGAANGSVRLWDLHSGSCVHKVKVHEGAILALTCTSKYVISSGVDDKLCIWEKRTGVVVHLLDLDSSGNNCLELLTENLLVTGGQGCINLLDITKGEVIRTIQLSEHDRMAFVHQIKVVANTVIVCDYASEMKVIHFPTVLEKAE